MKSAPLVLAVAFASAAAAQAPNYLLNAGSELCQEACLPPCLCPYAGATGTLNGTFSMRLLDSTLLEQRYGISAIDWSARLNQTEVRVNGIGTYTLRQVGPTVLQRLQLEVTIGPMALVTVMDSGFLPVDPHYPFPEFAITLSSPEQNCRRDTLTLFAGELPNACYANCDNSTTAPVLNVADFACFLRTFAAGDPYANCDESTEPPVLNVGDLACFLQRFAAGCP